MKDRLRYWFCCMFCLLLTGPVLAQDPTTGVAPATGQKPPTATQTLGSPTGEAIKELLKEWWLWVGLVAIIGLGGLLLYVRNKSDDD